MNTLVLEDRKTGLEQKTALYTIGYEGRGLEEFTSRLKDYGVEVLVDVRDVPLSRKKGFSKTPLSQYLEEEGIDYIHLKSLGSPKDIRDKVKTDGDYKYFYTAYSSYIKSQQDSVKTLHQIVVNSSVCIMCYERDPYSCHRLVVAEEVKKKDGNGLAVKHI
ncbi:MAG: DUF488 domain-containing protein [Candidatus Omnitrophota bacterium]|nr:DUF488 domain-containing protein [Candidatus Omnitrophota bacterium]